MDCPICGHSENGVIRTAATLATVSRTRQCSTCGHRWRTVEVKQDEYRWLAAVVEKVKELRELMEQ